MMNFLPKSLNKALLIAILGTLLIGAATAVSAQITSKCDSLNAAFSYKQTGNTVTVTSANEPTGSYMYWMMGDGQSRTGNPVTYSYAASSVTKFYRLCHVVYLSGSTSCKADTLCQQITVPGTGTCNSEFSVSIGTGGVVTFTNLSTASDSITSYSWVFGPNYPVSYLKNPTNTYTASGTYGVCLGISTQSGCTSEWCDTITITLAKSSCDSLSAYYNYTDTGDVYHFNNTYQQNPKGYHGYWTFGDGSSIVTGGVPMTHTFPSSSIAETYTVCFHVYLPNSSCATDSFCRSITVPATTTTGSCKANFTYTTGPNSGQVNFTNTSSSSDSITAYSWYFGDNTTSSTKNPVHTYTGTAATYVACMYITSSTGCRSEKCDTIKNPIIKSSCDSLNAYYDYTDTGNVYHFYDPYLVNPVGYHGYWNFGDGNGTVAGVPTTHTFPTSTAAVTYTVCFYVYLPNSTCKTDSFCRSITVPGVTTFPCDSLTAYYYPSGSGNTWTFTSAHNPAGAHQYWVFGDGTTGTGSPVTHTYPSSSTSISYTACQIVYAPNSGCKTDTFCRQITVPGVNVGTCHANFTWVDGSGRGQVNFTNTSTSSDSITAYSWYFGDNGTSSTKNPTHTYTGTATSYTVCMYITSSSGCRSEKCDTITISLPIPPCDSLTSAFDFTNSGNTFVFTSAGNPAGYHQYWSFGDGTYSTASASPVMHTYATSSATTTYTVCHYVYYPNATCKTDTTCEQVIVPGVTNTSCKADFTYSIGTNGAITFTDKSSGTPTTWRWSFGDANTAGSTQQSPTHTYTASGTYRVCLNITTASGCTSEFCDTVTVNLTNPCKLNSDFQYAIHTTWVSFYPSQVTGVIYANWNFGDGTTSTDDSAWITHSFPVKSIAVTYHVCHIVYGATTPGCSDTTCEDVTVPGTPITSCKAYFVWTQSSTGAIDFTDLSTSSDAITSWYWYFGDGSSSTTQSPAHTYATAGAYTACLYITTAGGCTSNLCDTVTVTATNPCSINSNFSYTNTGDAFTFGSTQNSTAAHQYWSFGDGTTGSGTPVNHTYAANSAAVNYTVCHFVYIPGTNCADTTCKEITVPGITKGSCNADYTWTLSTAAAGLVTFTNTSTSSDSVVAWSWYFGDGSASSNLFAPTHTYAPGVYYTCLRLQSVSGCVSYHCDSIHISGPANNCNAQFSYQLAGCDTVQFTNASTGGYTHTAWNFGDGSSSSEPNPIHVFAAGTWTVTLYAYNPNSNCTSSIAQTITVQPCNVLNDTICGVVFSDTNSNGVMDSTETPYANIEVHIDGNIVHADSFGHYMIILPAGSHTVYVVVPSGCVATLPLYYNGSTAISSYYKINGSAGGTFCGYNFGINCNVDHICGKVYYDTNNNGTQDSTESGLPNITILITGANGVVHHAYTDASGQFCETVPSGTYTITIGSTTYSICTTTPTAITVVAAGNGQSYTGNNFAVYCPPGEGDFSIQISPNSTVTPGFPAWYSIQVCNIGASPMSGTATMFYDPNILTYNYGLPPQDASTGNSVSWNITNLQPGACVYYWVAFNAIAPLNPGQPVFSEAIVTPANGYTDANPNNNIDTLHQEVMASWDPNSKEAYLTNYNNPAYQVISSLNANQKIEYTINFENDGNANAINIVVDDNLSPDLDANSFALISSSHPCTVSRNGSDVNFKFSNIQLPPISVNEPASHGYVKYSINAVAGLPAGHVISDPANVYFDYNAPVTTNSADVIMLDVTGINEVKPATIVLGPNPMSDYTMVTLNGNTGGSFKFRVMDMTGRIVNEQVSYGNTLEFSRNNLAAGMYSYYVIQNNVVVNKGKLVIE